ncbi:MAG: hypothetical protein IPJ77_06035 [Planctomycetes bacterium]|nr:hypothetical protein [Planctomycetota bacterium]
MEFAHEDVPVGDRSVLVVRIAGVLPAGSAARAESQLGLRYLGEHATADHSGIVLDLTALEYEWGDTIAVWVVNSPHRLRTKLVATGRTAAAVRALIESAGLERIAPRLLHSRVEAALAALA